MDIATLGSCVAIVMFNGLAATGVNQLYKQSKKA